MIVIFVICFSSNEKFCRDILRGVVTVEWRDPVPTRWERNEGREEVELWRESGLERYDEDVLQNGSSL